MHVFLLIVCIELTESIQMAPSPPPSPITPSNQTINVFNNSTQQRYWLWKSQADLDSVRSAVHKQTIETITRYIDDQIADELNELQAEHNDTIDATTHAEFTSDNQSPMRHHINSRTISVGTPSTLLNNKLQLPTPANSNNQQQPEDNQQNHSLISKTNTDIEYLTLDECRDFVLYYAQSIPSISTIMSYPSYITRTTLTLFQRFYIHTSPMQYHPKYIMLCCFFICGKAEDYWIKLDQLAERTHTLSDDISKYELIIINQCKFHLRIWHPVRPLNGLIIMMKEKYDTIISSTIEQRALQLIDTAYYNDCTFLYPPSNIALAALYAAIHEDGEHSDVINKLINTQLHNSSLYNKLVNRLNEIGKVLLDSESCGKRDRSELKSICVPIAEKQQKLQELFDQIAESSSQSNIHAREAARRLKLQQRNEEMQRQRDELLGINSNHITSPKRPLNNDNDNNDDDDDDVGFKIKRRKSKHNALIDDD